MRRLWLLLPLLTACPPDRSLIPQQETREAKAQRTREQIERLETLRSLGEGGWLLSVARGVDASLAQHALRALGRIQDPAAVPVVVEALVSPSPALREE